jgi:hypothetical protein
MTNFNLPFLIYSDENIEAKSDRSIDQIVAHRKYIIYIRTRCAEAQNWRCCYCGCHMSEEPNHRNSVSLEHVIPQSKGGTDDWENLAAACVHCNSARGNSALINDGETWKGNTSKKGIDYAKRVARYLRRAEVLLEKNFKMNQNIRSFEDWVETIRLPKEYMTKFMEEYKKIA